LEFIQTNFIRRSLNLDRQTSNYSIRCETARVKLKYALFCNLLRLWKKILAMENHRLVKICYDRLVQLHKPGLRDARYNWSTLLRHMLEDMHCQCIGFGFIWESQCETILSDNYDSLCHAMRMNCIDSDVSMLPYSTSNPFYYLSWTRWEPASYLGLHIPFVIKSLIAQVRFNSSHIYFRGNVLYLCVSPCALCGASIMDLEHILLRCTCLLPHRFKCRLLQTSYSLSHVLVSLKSADEDSVKSLFYFLVNVFNACFS